MSKIAEKVKTVAVKCNPPRMSRADRLRGCQTGLADKYKSKTEGIGRSVKDRAECQKKYAEGWEKIWGKKTG